SAYSLTTYDSLPWLNNYSETISPYITISSSPQDDLGVSVKQFGAKGDGVTDSTTAFIDAIKYIENIAKNVGIHKTSYIIIPAGSYLITQTLSIQLFTKFKASGPVTLRYSGTGPLFNVRNTTDVVQYRQGYLQQPFNVGNILDGSQGPLILKGSGKTSNQVGIKIGEDTLQSLHNTHTAWSQFSNIYLEGFQYGIRFTSKQVYITRFNNITISDCGTCISDEGATGYSNSGEQLTWTDCGFHNSDLFLEVTYSISHSFKGCSIDYNKAGIRLGLEGVQAPYNEQRFTQCWIEASNTPSQFPLIEGLGTKGTAGHFVIIDNSKIYFRDRKADTIIKGSLSLSIINTELFLNRYTHGNIAAGSIMCEDTVDIINAQGVMFHDNPIAISRSLAINHNSDFEADAVGATTFTGFSQSNVSGQASLSISDTKSYSGTKSMKIAGGGNTWATIQTEVLPIIGVRKLYGQARVYLSNTYAKASVKTEIVFYSEDKSTIIKTLAVSQDMDYRTALGGQPDGDRWFSLLQGTGNYDRVPPKATHAQFRLTIGDIKTSDVFIDDMILTGI
ncbi:hypothetical protein CEW46_30560, partial [Bacillus cereus]